MALLPEGESSGQPAPAPPGGVAAVLAADDNRTNLFIMEKLLRRAGVRPLLARDGEEAVSIAHSHRPAVVLMDISMPRLNGLDATRRIKQLFGARAPLVVAVTATDTTALRDACSEAGCDGFIAKPIIASDLIELIRSIVASSAEGTAD